MGLRNLARVREPLGRVGSRLRGSREAFALALLGILVGACAGIVSIGFRAAIELWQALVVPPAGFAAVDAALRFALPLLGTALGVIMLWLIARGPVHTGVPHVLERLGREDGRLPLKNARFNSAWDRWCSASECRWAVRALRSTSAPRAAAAWVNA
jgi:hypothetical protein